MRTQTITFSNPKTWNLAQARADKLGISIAEYFNRLVLWDTSRLSKPGGDSSDEKDPWGPVPPAVLKRWEKEIAEFDEEDRKHPQPRFSSGREMVDYIRRQP